MASPQSSLFALLEPLLTADDGAPWDQAAETAAAFFDAPSAALVVASTEQRHSILGQRGLGPELAATRSLAAPLSPARLELSSEPAQVLDAVMARRLGLAPWMAACGGVRWLAAAPLRLRERTVGALVLGFQQLTMPHGTLIEGLGRLARDQSALVTRCHRERCNERWSGQTALDPMASRMALRGSLRRLSMVGRALEAASERLWRALEARPPEGLAALGIEAGRQLHEARIGYDHLRKRFDAQVERGLVPDGEQARAQALQVALGLVQLGPLGSLGRALGARSLGPEQGRRALSLLGPEPPRPGAVVEPVEALLGWIETAPRWGVPPAA